MELYRILIGLSVVILVPRSMTWMHRTHLLGPLCVFGYGAYIIFPSTRGWQSWILWAASGVIGLAAIWLDRDHRPRELSLRILNFEFATQSVDSIRVRTVQLWRYNRRQRSATHAELTFALAILSLTVVGASYGRFSLALIGELLTDHRIAIVLSGLLLSVFAGHDVVIRAVDPFLRASDEGSEELTVLAPTSEHIGWLERALVFAFVVGGQAEAAAIAIAAKSLARLPDISERKVFTEYFLVGTLTSLLVALTLAVLVRVALGLSPL